MEFATDVILLVLSLINNYLIIYLFPTGVDCEITYVVSTELNNVPFIIAKVTCTINFSDKETWMLRLNIWAISVLEGSKYLTQNDHFFDKEKTNFEAVNNLEEYFRVHKNLSFMVFPNNMVVTSSHIVFNILLDLSDDQYYHLHIKTTTFCFTFVLVIVNPIIFD